MFKRIAAAAVSMAMLFSFVAPSVYAIENADLPVQIIEESAAENEIFAPETADSEEFIVSEETLPADSTPETEQQVEPPVMPQEDDSDTLPPDASENEEEAPADEQLNFETEKEPAEEKAAETETSADQQPAEPEVPAEEEQPAEDEEAVVEEQIAEEGANAVTANSYGTSVTSGNCGTSAVWTLYDSDADATADTLVLSGSGAMDDYDYNTKPWESYKKNIKTVVVEDGITAIGDYAFYDFYNLAKVTISATVTDLGICTFGDCTALKSINFNGTWDQWLAALGGGSSYADMGRTIFVVNDYAYTDNGDGTATITGAKGTVGGALLIPQTIGGLTVTAVGEKAFANNTSITGVSFADSVATIGRMAFYETNLKGVEFGKGLKTIDDYAFYKALNFKRNYDGATYSYYGGELNLPEGLEFLGTNAFGNVGPDADDGNIVHEIYIPSTLKTAEENCFEWDYYSSIEIFYNGTPQQWVDLFEGTTIPSMDPMTFAEETMAFRKNGEKGYRLTRWENASGNIVLPTEFRGLPVTTYSDGIFNNNTDITSVIIPESYTSLNWNSFIGCTNLVSADIRASYYQLPSSFFSGCTNLETVKLPGTIKEILNNAFKDCINLKDVYYHSSYNWENISIESGNALLGIAEMHFETDWGYKVYERYKYVDGLETFEDAIAILGHSNPPEDMVIPSEMLGLPVRCIGGRYDDDTKDDAAFVGDTKVKTLTVPETVLSIGNYTFADSTVLETVNITTDKIGAYAFSNCTALKNVTVSSAGSSNSSEIRGYAFSGCTALETLVVRDNYPNKYGYEYFNIYNYAFENCTSLKSITLPENIGWYLNAFTNVPRNAKIYVEKDSDAQRQLMEMGFTNFAVHIVLKEIRAPKTASVELGKTIPALKVTKYPAAAAETLNIQWSSGDSTVASVDPVTGIITGHKLGSAVITATDLNSGKTARTTVSVVIPYADKLTAVVTPQIPKAGLELGQSAQLQIYSTSTGLVDPAYLTFTSSDDSIATVDENGVITAVNDKAKAYTVKITAKLTDDSKNRNVAVSVTTIPKQAASMTIYAPTEETVDGVIVVPFEKVAAAAYSFALNAVPVDANGEMTTTPITWKSTNTGVAAVAKDGTVTIKAKANGVATIVATANDLAKTTAEITIDVRDYTPRIETNTATLNTYTTLGAQLQLVKVYDNNIVSVTFDNTEFFNATYDAETDIVYVDANGFVKNGSYKLNLITETEKGTYQIPVTIKAANKLPAITIKQVAPFNLFLKNSSATVNFAVKDEVISNVVLCDTDTFAAEYNSENGTLNIVYADPADPVSTYENGKADTAATLEIYLENYTDPIVKTFKVNAKETKVTLAPSRTSTKFTIINRENTPIQLSDKTTKQVINLDECTVELLAASDGFAEISVDGKDLAITPVLADGKFADGKTSHAVKMEVQHENWLRSVAVNHTISVNTAAPTVKAKSATLTLNSLFDASASTVMIPNIDNCPQPLYWEISPANPAQAAETDKLNVTYDGWNITAAFADAENLPANGSYKYNLVAYIEADGAMALKPVAITVRVNTTVPKVTLGKTSVKLNSQLEDSIAITTKIPAGYLLEDILVENGLGNTVADSQISVSFDADNKTVVARIADTSLANGTYKYTLTPVVKSDVAGSEKLAELKPLNLNVSVYSAAPAITASGKGAIDLTNRDNGIIYTITAGKNFNYDVNAVNDQSFAISGADKDKFEIELMQPNAKGQPQVMVNAKAGVEFSTKVTYQYALDVDIDGMSQPVSTTVFKVKPKQTALKLTATGSLNVYQSTKSGRVYINVVTPVGAQIEDIQIVSKGTTVPNGALDMEVQKNSNGRWVLSYSIENASKLKANASYRIALAVTAEGNATDKAPQTFNVALKVKR